MSFYSTKMYFSTFSTANVSILCYSNLQRYIFHLPIMYFFYAIIYFQQRYIFNFLNRQCISTMLILFSKTYFQLSKPSPFTPWGVMLTRFAMLGMIAWPTLPPGPLECEGSEWNHPHSVYLRYVNERTMVKCKLHQ